MRSHYARIASKCVRGLLDEIVTRFLFFSSSFLLFLFFESHGDGLVEYRSDGFNDLLGGSAPSMKL